MTGNQREWALLSAMSAACFFGLLLCAWALGESYAADHEAELARMQALHQCRQHARYIPQDFDRDNLNSYITGEVPLAAMLYTYNMVDSRNLPWINCMLAEAPHEEEE